MAALVEVDPPAPGASCAAESDPVLPVRAPLGHCNVPVHARPGIGPGFRLLFLALNRCPQNELAQPQEDGHFA